MFKSKSQAYTLRRKKRKEEKRREKKEQQKTRRFQAKVPSVLGIMAAQGFNKNMLSTAMSLSKNTRKNYLLEMLHKRRLQEKQEKALSKDFYDLIDIGDFLSIQYKTNHPSSHMNQYNIEYLAQYVIRRLIYTLREIPITNENTKKQSILIENLFKILKLFLTKLERYNYTVLKEIWKLPPGYVEKLLNEVPGLREKSKEQEVLLENHLREMIQYWESEIDLYIGFQKRALEEGDEEVAEREGERVHEATEELSYAADNLSDFYKLL